MNEITQQYYQAIGAGSIYIRFGKYDKEILKLLREQFPLLTQSELKVVLTKAHERALT